MTIDYAVGASGQRLKELQRNLAAINKEKIDIEAERETLRLKALNLLREYKTIEQNLLAEAETFSKAWTRTFVQAMRTTLPRELRDLIYAELVVSPKAIAIMPFDPWAFWGHDELETEVYDDRIASVRKQYQQFISPAFVGDEVSQEAAQTFYERNLFDVRDVEVLDDFLTKDIFQAGYVPARMIRKLRIHLWESDFRRDSTKADEYGDADRHLEVGKRKEFDKVLAIRDKNACELEIRARTDARRQLHPIIRNLDSIVFDLKDAGFTISVSQAPSKGKKKKKMKRGMSSSGSPVEDWTHLFNVTRDEWNEKKQNGTLRRTEPEPEDPWDAWWWW